MENQNMSNEFTFENGQKLTEKQIELLKKAEKLEQKKQAIKEEKERIKEKRKYIDRALNKLGKQLIKDNHFKMNINNISVEDGKENINSTELLRLINRLIENEKSISESKRAIAKENKIWEKSK